MIPLVTLLAPLVAPIVQSVVETVGSIAKDVVKFGLDNISKGIDKHLESIKAPDSQTKEPISY